MTEKYIDLVERIKRDRDMGPLTGLDRVTYTLRWLDDHPDQTPGRAIAGSGVYDQDNLRNRIAEVIAGEEDHPHPRGYAAHAQAIIDDLGLTVEQRMRSWDDEAGEVRYVGRWEAND